MEEKNVDLIPLVSIIHDRIFFFGEDEIGAAETRK